MAKLLWSQKLGKITVGDKFDFQGAEWSVTGFDIKVVAVPTGKQAGEQSFALGFIDSIKLSTPEPRENSEQLEEDYPQPLSEEFKKNLGET